MSLVVSGSASLRNYQNLEEPWLSVSTALVGLVLSIVMLRGVFGILRDMLGLMIRFFKTKVEDKEVQTDEYFTKLPAELLSNPGSEVFHLRDCHHVGLRAVRSRACTLCRNKF